ncbi:hypothetical protein T08_12249 [Trichinella sp. T8]|nr:hypothetical protein T08_12249 [Trichinella sp. T8]
MGDTKKKCRQSNIEYLKYGFIPSSGNTPECPLKTNERLPMYLISEKKSSGKQGMKGFVLFSITSRQISCANNFNNYVLFCDAESEPSTTSLY